jgi:hypothetical protein
MALTVMKMVRAITGSDNLGDLLGERDSAVAKLAAAREEITRLEAQRLSAESFDDAEAINQRIARVTWTVDQISVAILPALEQRIVDAQAAKAASRCSSIRPPRVLCIRNCARPSRPLAAFKANASRPEMPPLPNSANQFVPSTSRSWRFADCSSKT